MVRWVKIKSVLSVIIALSLGFSITSYGFDWSSFYATWSSENDPQEESALEYEEHTQIDQFQNFSIGDWSGTDTSYRMSAEELIGEYVEFGKFNKKPIIWRVVGADGNKALLISDKILSFKAFDMSAKEGAQGRRLARGSNSWEESDIFRWLNSSAPNTQVVTGGAVWRGVNPYIEDEAGFLHEFTSGEIAALVDRSYRTMLAEIDMEESEEGTAGVRRNVHGPANIRSADSFRGNYDTEPTFRVGDINRFEFMRDLRGRVEDDTEDEKVRDFYEGFLDLFENVNTNQEFVDRINQIIRDEDEAGIFTELELSDIEKVIESRSIVSGEKERVAAHQLNIDDYVEYGKYLGEPILWQVIAMEDGNPLLWSEKILSFKAFDAKGDDTDGRDDDDDNRRLFGSNFWEKSNLREWLNSEHSSVAYSHNPPNRASVTSNPYARESGFLSGFSTVERGFILPRRHKVLLTDVDADVKEAGSGSYDYTGDVSEVEVGNYDEAKYMNVTDRVFLLSIKELAEYVDRNGNDEHRRKVTSEALEQSDGGYNNWHDGYGHYWLRTPKTDSHSLHVVNHTGTIDDDKAYNGGLGVVPALSLISRTLFSGDGTKEEPYKLAEPNLREQRVADLIHRQRYSSISADQIAQRNRLLLEHLFEEHTYSSFEDPFSKMVRSKVFLPSIDEMNDYVISRTLNVDEDDDGGEEGEKKMIWDDDDFLKKPTASAAAIVLEKISEAGISIGGLEENRYWRYWLRTPRADSSEMVNIVTETGKISDYTASIGLGGVAPAVWLDLNMVWFEDEDEGVRKYKEQELIELRVSR